MSFAAAVGYLSAWKQAIFGSRLPAGANANGDVQLNGVVKMQAPAESTDLLLIADLG